MKLFRLSCPAAALALGAAALGLSSAAHAVMANPPIQMAPQGVEFMCGGKNKDEIAFMETVAPRWAATFEFAVSRGPRGQFPESVAVKVIDKYSGAEVMQAASNGPFMLARLEPGTYDVQATLGNLTLTQTVNVALGVPGRATPSHCRELVNASLIKRGIDVDAEGSRPVFHHLATPL